MKKYVIGVDLGGTKITTAISDLTGEIIEKAHWQPDLLLARK